MALPIGETPILTGKEATEFINKVREEAQKPVEPIPTPKLEKAYELIKGYASQHAELQQKRVH